MEGVGGGESEDRKSGTLKKIKTGKCRESKWGDIYYFKLVGGQRRWEHPEDICKGLKGVGRNPVWLKQRAEE